MSAINYYHSQWLDLSLPVSERDEALLFLSHFVGDIHQPMHVSYASDRGGTQKRVIFEGKLMSLHSLWDSDILYCGTRASWKTLGKQLYRQHKQYSGNEIYNPHLWADESFTITQRIYANFSKQLPDHYCSQFHGVAETRLVLASQRLARLLNGVQLSTSPNLSEHSSDEIRHSSGGEDGDKVQSAPNLISKFSDLWKLILTLLP
jgi:hypothetical protein